MSRFAVILAAAGKSSRFGSQSSRDRKVFREIGGRAVWLRSTELFINRPDVVQTLVVVSPEDLDWFRERFRANLAFMNVDLIAGGAERSDSVRNALEQVRPEADFVAIHDAARPVMAPEWIDAVFSAAEKHGAAIPAIPVSSTVKRVTDSLIRETVSRAGLYAAQTPQVFRKEVLLNAWAICRNRQPTDDAQVVEESGHQVAVVDGSPLNIKITTAEDLRIAEAFLTLLPKQKLTGLLHPFAEDRPGWLTDR